MRSGRSIVGKQLKTVIDNRGGPPKLGRHPPKMSATVKLSTITVHVPISMQQRGARKVVMTPPGQPHWIPQRTSIDDTLVKAIARAHRWSRMLERGAYGSMTELAKAEGVTESYLARILRLTLLSPKIVDAILANTSNDGLQLQHLVKPFPLTWEDQDLLLGTNH